ncbi:MAG: hypothetical protein U0796_14005 [Gemmatales bacterium]
MSSAASPSTKASLFGPVFRWELIRLSRRGMWHLGRLLFAVGLLAYLYASIGNLELHTNTLALFGERIARLYCIVQFIAVIILTPLLTCGTILDERNQRTLPLLLSSLLHPEEVVHGKLCGRLAGLTMIILTGLPILALLQFLGGLDYLMVIEKTAIAVVIMAVLGMNGIYQSSRSRTLSGAVIRTYCQTAIHVVVAWMVFIPFTVTSSLYFHWNFLKCNGLLALGAALLLAVLALRRLVKYLPDLALTSNLADNRLSSLDHSWTDISQLVWLFRSRFGAPREAWEYRFQHRETDHLVQDDDVAIRFCRVPEVSDRPLLWKDMHFPLDRRVQWFFTAGTTILVFFVLAFIMTAVGTSNRARAVQAIVSWIAYLIMLGVMIIVGLRASATLPEEHQQKTLHDLLCWPWSAKQLLWQKWLGVLGRNRFLLVTVLCVVLPMLSFTKGLMTLWIVPVFFAQVCVLASLCLAVSLVCRLRIVWSRLLSLALVTLSLISLPSGLAYCWKHLPAVQLPLSANVFLSQRGGGYYEGMDKVLYFEEVRHQHQQPVTPYHWLHITQVIRNTLCPWEAWSDLFNSREFWPISSMNVTFDSAMQINSPWSVHAITICVLLAISAVNGGFAVLLLGRWRMG